MNLSNVQWVHQDFVKHNLDQAFNDWCCCQVGRNKMLLVVREPWQRLLQLLQNYFASERIFLWSYLFWQNQCQMQFFRWWHNFSWIPLFCNCLPAECIQRQAGGNNWAWPGESFFRCLGSFEQVNFLIYQDILHSKEHLHSLQYASFWEEPISFESLAVIAVWTILEAESKACYLTVHCTI